jgi:hypothetical protein
MHVCRASLLQRDKRVNLNAAVPHMGPSSTVTCRMTAALYDCAVSHGTISKAVAP